MPRKKPFSGKQKREQLRQRRRRKAQEKARADEEHYAAERVVAEATNAEARTISSFGAKASADGTGVASLVLREDDSEVRRRRLRGERETIRKTANEVSSAFLTASHFLEHPTRAQEAGVGAEFAELEKRRFSAWLVATDAALAEARHVGSVSPYERNLEVWRQLWRVCEGADVVAFVADARLPLIPPSLLKAVRAEGKGCVVVLTKVDLIGAARAMAWKEVCF